jgi:hypothetical protein
MVLLETCADSVANTALSYKLLVLNERIPALEIYIDSLITEAYTVAGRVTFNKG